MILLSAQPDAPLFFWQLEVFLESVSKINYPTDKVHVLIGVNPYTGASALCKQFILDCEKKATFFLYPDIRSVKMYVSSIRPHIIKQHFSSYPFLSKEVLFYHDSDIVFTKYPDFSELLADDTWYVSDTRGYLNASYIRKCGSRILDEMCKIVGVTPQIVIDNDEDAGGAQYILKNTDYQFWEKVEKDSDELFTHLVQSEERYALIFSEETGKSVDEYKPIQSWCSDMWAILWNGYFFGNTVKIHSQLNFLWPLNKKGEWENCCIYHDAGVTEKTEANLFFKGNYHTSFPFYFNNSHVDQSTCSFRYVNLIEELSKNRKYDLRDVTFLIPVRVDSDDRLRNLSCIIAFLNKYFLTNISILEADVISRVPLELLSENVKYRFVYDESQVFYHTRYNNLLCQECDTPIIALYDTDVISSPENLYKAAVSIPAR